MIVDGAWTALVTPFNDDLSVDMDGLKLAVEFQISNSITGLLPAGTTGESPTLSWEEHRNAVDEVIKGCKGKVPVLAGSGSNSTDEALAISRHAAELGAEAVLLVDCYYNGPSSQELRDEYYAVVAAALPDTVVIPYVIPGRTGCALGVEDLALLYAKYPNVSCVKEATGDLVRMAKTRALLGPDFSIMSGDDDLTFTMMSDPNIKANGVISVTSNVAPKAVADMVRLAIEGDIAGAEKLKDALSPLFNIVTVKIDNPRTLPSGETVLVNDRYRNPQAFKTLMAGLGMPSGPCRKPLGKMTAAGVAVVRNAAKEVWEKNPKILQPVGDFFGLDIAARLADDSIWNALAG